MPIVQLVILLIVIGVALYLINTVIPMDQKIKTIINVIVIIAVLIWLLDLFGLMGSGVWVGRRR